MNTISPNLEQVLSALRKLLAAGGPLSAVLIMQGIPPEKVNAWMEIAMLLLGIVPLLVSIVWGMFTHTDRATIAAVQKNPEVSRITVKDDATGAAANAVDNIAMTKVISESDAQTKGS